MFEGPAWLVAQFYSLTNSYAVSIGLVALVVMILVTPLTLKSTKGMLEMQRLQPEMKRLQAQHRGDRQKLNEEMMKLYQEHKVNPLASCLPLLLQMPVFFIMYRVLHGLSNLKDGTFDPDYISKSSELYKSLDNKTEMLSLGLDLSKTPAHFISESFGKGLIYAGLVILLGALYFIQQRMVASRASVSPTMSPAQAKLMQYLPVVFAVFQIFFLTGLVIYYIVQALFRIGQNAYITRRFYHGEESLGRVAQAAGVRAREEAQANGTAGGPGAGGMFAQAKRDAQARREAQDVARKGGTSTRPQGRGSTAKKSAGNPRPNNQPGSKPAGSKQAGSKQAGSNQAGDSKSGSSEQPVPAATSKRVTPPKNRPTPSTNRPQRPMASGRPGAPARPKPPKK